MIKCHNTMGSEFSADPSKYPQKKFRDKLCRWCGESFAPLGPSHHYCSDTCRKFVHADKHYKRSYGVGVVWVLKKLEEQGFKCAICKDQGFKMREDHISGLNLDHCHVTGIPRALLCHNCNRGLGLFQENPDFLRAAANYLEENYEPSKYEEFESGGSKRVIQEIIRRQEES